MLARDMDGYNELRNEVISEQKDGWDDIVETLDNIDIDISDTAKANCWTSHIPADGKVFCVWRYDNNTFVLAGPVGARWYQHWNCFKFKKVI